LDFAAVETVYPSCSRKPSLAVNIFAVPFVMLTVPSVLNTAMDRAVVSDAVM